MAFFSKNRSRSRTNPNDGRIIITGTGRAGTTLLIQFFTALEFNTGYSLEEALSQVDNVSNAGLERPLVAEENPYVIKSPWFADTLSEALENKQIDIHAAIIPMRSIFGAAESRRRVTREGAQAGGLWYTTDPDQQESALAMQFYKALYPLVQFDIDIHLLEFPRFARDPDYLYESLEKLLVSHGVGKKEAVLAFNRVVEVSKISKFNGI